MYVLATLALGAAIVPAKQNATAGSLCGIIADGLPPICKCEDVALGGSTLAPLPGVFIHLRDAPCGT